MRSQERLAGPTRDEPSAGDAGLVRDRKRGPGDRQGSAGNADGTVRRRRRAHSQVHRRNVAGKARRPAMSMPEILRWADEYHDRHGKWPNANSGTIPEAPGESWLHIERALNQGHRGLPGRSTLARLFRAKRGDPSMAGLVPLTIERILKWADAYFMRKRDWPNRDSGPIPESPGDTWAKVDDALSHGLRGLEGGSSIHRLCALKRGPRHPINRPDLTILADPGLGRRVPRASWPVAGPAFRPDPGGPGRDVVHGQRRRPARPSRTPGWIDDPAAARPPPWTATPIRAAGFDGRTDPGLGGLVPRPDRSMAQYQVGCDSRGSGGKLALRRLGPASWPAGHSRRFIAGSSAGPGVDPTVVSPAAIYLGVGLDV